jgi:polysaccharide biosynthesis transport protein
LLQRYKEIGVAGGIGTAPVSIVDRADVPTGPFKPNLLWNLLAGLGLGLAAGIATAFALEYMNDTIKTRSDVRNKLGLACLGAIPKRTRKVPLLEELEDPTSATSEAYSTVSTSLRFSTESGVPKTLLISSARAAEGKSSTAVSLAHNLARLGKSVLLIDSDLRKPAFRSLTNGQGLSRLLTSDDKVADHVTPTQYENLWLLACGPIPPNPADLLSSNRLRAIIKEASSQVDVVLVDAPPVLGLADAPLIASIVNEVVLVIESGKTRTAAALEALNRLRGGRSDHHRRDADQVDRGVERLRLWLQVQVWRDRQGSDRDRHACTPAGQRVRPGRLTPTRPSRRGGASTSDRRSRAPAPR